jgi:hypothetical protein
MHDLTIDYVVPKSKGGEHSWENLVAACKACNHRKGGKSLREARMVLRKLPIEPRAGQYYTIERRLDGRVYDAWSKFLPGFNPIGKIPSLDYGFSRAPNEALPERAMPARDANAPRPTRGVLALRCTSDC